MRLIDGDAIIIDLLDHGIEGVQTDDYAEFQQIVADAPTVDAVPVCRCKDCSVGTCYSDGSVLCEWSNGFYADDYCPRGKRKGGDE